jgi:hypothetical protein
MMIKTRSALLLIFLVGLSACAQPKNSTSTPPAPNPTHETIPATSIPSALNGVEGFVTKGPTCPGPVRIGATECQDQPYQASITVLDENGNQVTQFQTDVLGYFKIHLDPGIYILHPQPGKPLPISTDQTVVVVDGQFTRVMIKYDTGMR